MAFKYDCAGWATKAGVQCSDGRTIMPNAFKDDIKNGKVVPIVYNHDHSDPEMILGHALLENRDTGVYAYCKFNDSAKGAAMKDCVHNGDITQFSIYANKLKQTSKKEVLHGCIRELSMVLAGANPEATIDQPYVLVHSDYEDVPETDDAYIYPGSEFSDVHVEHGEITNGFAYKKEAEYTAYPFSNEEKAVTHAGSKDSVKKDKTIGEIWETFNDDQKKLAFIMAAFAVNGDIEHSDIDEDDTSISHAGEDSKTVEDVYNTLNEEQKEALNIIVGFIVEDSKKKKSSKNDEERDDPNMKHNIFEDQMDETREVIQHSDEEIFSAIEDARINESSLKRSFLQHGITHLDYLYPEDRLLDSPPRFINRPTGWVQTVLNGVHHSPFSKIKSQFADITGEEARARGYIKGDQKEDEVFTLLRRSVGPTTIYKHQSFDRDDVIDITDFDIIAWVKAEMRLKLDEEIARAILIGDGRSNASRIKIKEDCIIPIWKDDPTLFTVLARYEATGDPSVDIKKFIRAAVKARKNYRGSGSPTLFTTEDMLTDILLLTDNIGRDLYEDEAKVAKKLRVKDIVTVPVMENQTRTVEGVVYTLNGIIVNLTDYNVGADKGGAVNMFDDFDIDYNKQKYLIETRCSGALTVPFSAIIIESYPQANN